MGNLKSNDNNLDRLSGLPDSLILEILSFLDMRDVVRTTLLSKRWRYIWVTLHCLDFSTFPKNSIQARSFVNRALMLWKGAQIQKLTFSFEKGFDASSYSDMDSWLLFAKERKVEELCISLPIHYCKKSKNYRPPQCFYECSSIRKLTVRGVNLQIRGNVRWDQLECLMICGLRFTENVINQIVSGAPRLAILGLLSFKNQRNLSIRSSSLKSLAIYCIQCDPSNHTVLTIWAPNLQLLKITGAPHSKCLLKNVSSLTEANLEFWGERDVVGEAVRQILRTIQHVETVILSAPCLKVLGDMKGKSSISPLLKVKLLRINGYGLTDPNKLVGLLEIFPKMKMLAIDWTHDVVKQDMRVPFKFDGENYTKSEANILKSLLLQLRTIEITWYSYKASIFEFIEFLLKHGTMIEKMVIREGGSEVVESEDMFVLAQTLVSLQRSFPTVDMQIFSKK
ncbi:hypothetical protein C2S51_021438 [Perilla frutescens var. frutescens]|nr:hypothetical protein C2S51_021438 [Perilla frutescens var. frutescens]